MAPLRIPLLLLRSLSLLFLAATQVERVRSARGVMAGAQQTAGGGGGVASSFSAPHLTSRQLIQRKPHKSNAIPLNQSETETTASEHRPSVRTGPTGHGQWLEHVQGKARHEFHVSTAKLAKVEGSSAPIAFSLRHVTDRMGIAHKSEEFHRVRLVSSFARHSLSTPTAVFPKTSGVPNLLYYVVVALGKPLKPYALQFDTGSGPTWLQCNCQLFGCIKDVNYTTSTGTPLSVYDPSASSTSQVLCMPSSGSTCLPAPYLTTCTTAPCAFSYFYGGGAVYGYHYQDIISLRSSGGAQFLQRVGFACVNQIYFQSSLGLDGIMGVQFGPNSQSILYQLYSAEVLAGTIAFCFDGENESGSKVRLGAGQTPPNMQTTQLYLTNEYSAFVDVQSIHVGSRGVKGSTGLGGVTCTQGNSCRVKGGVLVDTGTSVTLLRPRLYNRIKQRLGGSGTFRYTVSGFDCTSRKLSQIPSITIFFRTSSWTIPSSTFMFQSGSTGLFCFGANSVDGLGFHAIIGDSWVQNTFIQMDFVNAVFGFAIHNCTTSTLFN